MTSSAKALLLTGLLCMASVLSTLPARAAEAMLSTLVEEAISANPDLQAAEERWRMFERKVLPATTLDDPMLTLGLSNFPVDTFDADQTPMTGRDIVLAQKFPFPGKLGAKGEMAEQQALWYRALYEEGRLQLARQVKEGYFDLWVQQKGIEVTERNLTLLDSVIRTAETLYTVGKAGQQDVLKAQVERSKVMDRLLAQKQQRDSAQASLNTLLGRPPEAPLEGMQEVEMTEFHGATGELADKAESARPLFAAYRSLIDRYKVQKTLAGLDYRPDFNLFAGYKIREENMGDDGVDFFSAGVTLNLPVWRQKRGEAVAEADSGIRMALRQYEDQRNRVRFNISDAAARLERSRQQVLLYRTGIIPQSTQALQSATSAYQVGKTEFLSLLDSLATLYRYEMDYYRALADHEKSLARLEAEAGVPLGASKVGTNDLPEEIAR